MAKESGSALGSVLGVVIGVILIAGIAGTPFYLSMLQSENRGVNVAVDDDVAALRRVVEHLDQNLAAISDANSFSPDDELTPDNAAGLTVPESRELSASLDRTRKLLVDADIADKGRGTIIGGVSIPTGGKSPAEVVTAVTKRYQTENKQLESLAQGSINAIRGIRFGAIDANESLEANRSQAIYWTTVAKIHSNRADLEEDFASLLMRYASWNVDVIATLQLDIEATEAQMPTTTIAALREEASKIEQEIEQIEETAGDLRNDASDLSEKLAAAEEEAAAINGEMAELEAIGLEDSVDRSRRYLQLTTQSNEVESRIAVLKNGAATEDEEAAPGLRDVEYRLKQSEESIAGWRKALASFEEQIETLTATEQELTGLRSDFTSQKQTLASEVEALLAKAAEHQADAQKSRDEAQNALTKARQLASKAVTLAGRRTSEIKNSAPPGDELADMVGKDGDTKASLLCLAAEVDFTEALLLTKRIQTLQDAFDASTSIAKMINTEAPEDPAATIEGIQTAAAEKLVSAAKRYEEAANSLKASSTQTPAGTISGNNYVWQTNIGLASVELLRSTLAAAATGDVDTEAQDRAYNLLVDAVKDREKSPLLTPAVDVIKYLQHRVAE